MKKKIGVYICHCGGNISDYVDVEKVYAEVRNEKGVALAKITMFACADANQKEMEADIPEKDLDGVVVASCSPQLHLTTFRAVVERAGLNKYDYVHANIREQGSWAHSDNKSGATENAIHVVKAAIAKVRNAESLEPIKISSVKAVAVIGAGVSGMRSAIALAKAGCKVYIIERDHFVGGRVAQWENLFSTNETGEEIIKRLYNDTINNDNITLYTGAQVLSQSGNIGSYRLKVQINPGFVRNSVYSYEMDEAISVCPIKIPDLFNFGFTQRKAIYRNHSGQLPIMAVIDDENCTRCGDCEKVCKDIDFSQQKKEINIEVGSVLVASGFDTYTPKNNEFGYCVIDNVITLPQLKRLVAMSDRHLEYKGNRIKNIAYIYCVGSRQLDGENKYCSRYCCTAAIHTATEIRRKYKEINNYHFTRGVRTYGKQEIYYSEALKMGDVFMQSFDNELPEVLQKGNKTFVKIKDILTEQKELKLQADLVVLVTSMVPRDGISVNDLFKLPKGRDGFLKEIHLKLRPVETVIDGITIAGCCQGPMNLTESVNSALSAATKSYSYVSKGELELEPIIAKVDKEACTWCDACFKACPFDAIIKVEEGFKVFARVSDSICKGCGMCLPVCPKDAIELNSYTNREIEEMIDMLASD
ncbi:MAG: CoB--CoM heterodisulfide reductase iron-sulfur subunit A family protein [Bacteroidales bacterium]|nr:CoB--CoM heterodisulfide reductase iron-sulfur subunit A family protein [Bacteroidales bacterium]